MLLPVNGVDRLYTLVVIHAYRPELGVEIGEPGVKVVRRLIDFDHPEFSSEDDSVDEMGLAFHARTLVHGKEFSVFLVRQVKEIAVLSRVGKHLSPLGVFDLCSWLHSFGI